MFDKEKEDSFNGWWGDRGQHLYPFSAREGIKVVFFDAWYRCQKHLLKKESTQEESEL